MALILTPEQQAAAGSLATPQPTEAPVPSMVIAPPAPTVAGGPPAANENMLGAPIDLAAMPMPKPAPGSFGAKLGQALDKPENAIPLTASGKPVPGSWARSLVGAAQGVLAGFGDIPTGKAPVGGGFTAGFAGASRAEAERKQQAIDAAQKAKQEQSQEARENQKADDAHLLAQQNLAHQNAQFQTQEKLAHQIGVIDPMISQGSKVFKILTNAESGHPAPIAARDITSDELKAGVIAGKWNTHDYTAYQTGKEVTGQDENGDPIYRTTYSVVKSGGPVTLTDDDKDTIDFMNKNAATDQVIKPGQTLTFDQLNQLYQNASDNFTANEAKKQALVEAGLKTQKEADDMDAIKASPEVVKLLASNPNPVLAYQNMLATAAKNPEYAKQVGNIANDFRQFFGIDKQGKSEFDKLLEDYNKNLGDSDKALTMYQNNPDKMSGDNAVSAVAAADAHLADPDLPPDQKAKWAQIKKQANQTRELTIADKKALKDAGDSEVTGDVTLRGQAYLDSIPDGDGKETIRQIISGQMPMASLAMLTRTPSGQKLLNSVALAAPDDGKGGGFDQSKIMGYQNAVKEFTSAKRGTVGWALNNGGTAMKHLAELRSLNTPESKVLNTPAYKAYMNKLNTLAGELVGFYGLPSTNESEENMKAGMEGVGSREAAMATQAGSMADKLHSFKQTWDNAAPSREYHRPMPYIDADAQAALKTFVPGFNLDVSAPPKLPPAVQTPKGALGQATAADGRTTIFHMPGNTFQDASGNPYDANGKPLGAK